MHTWRIVPKVFGRSLARDGTHDFRGKLTKVIWRYDPPNEFEFQCSIDDPALARIEPSNTTEIALRLGQPGDVVMTGRVTTRRADSDSRLMTCTVKDPMWYLQRRYVGDAERTNYLENGSFEDGTSGWTAVGVSEFTDATDHNLLGSHSGTIQSDGNPNAYISQSLAVTTGRLGLAMHLTAWLRISILHEAAGFNLGMLLRRVGGSGAGSQAVQQMTTETPKGSWQRFSIVINVPPDVTEFVEARLYAPTDGRVAWDAVTLTVQESLYFSPEDGTGGLGHSVEQIVNYAQGEGQFGALAPGKSNLEIDVAVEPTGIEIERVFQLADHQKIYDGGQGHGVLDEYMKGKNRIDLYWDYDNRVLHGAYPQKGRLIEELWYYNYSPTDKSFNDQFVIVGWEYGDSVEQTANDIVMLGGWGGAGNDPTREEGYYSNPTSMGGLTLEEVDTAPQTAPINVLDRLAKGRGEQVEMALITPKITIAEERDPFTHEVSYPLINEVFPGDRVDIEIIDGDFELSGRFRIVEMELDPENETIAVTLNPTFGPEP